MSITDLVLADLVDLDELQLIDLAQKLLNVAAQKIEVRSLQNEEK